MTVVKRQAAAQSGVSSEVEVLKALKSLFEHHKALDEKVRERLRVSLEKNTSLEDELQQAKDELQQLKSGNYTQNDSTKENGEVDKDSQKQNNGEINIQQEMADFAVKTHELQTIIEKQTAELSQWQRRVSDLNNKISEHEDNISRIQKDFSKSQDMNLKLQRDLRENVAQKEDQEERITTLEKRYLNAQREASSLHDLNEKLDQELRHKEAQIKLHEEKIAAIQEKLELSEQKLAQYSKLPEMEEELKARMEALTQVGSQVGRVFQMLTNGKQKHRFLISVKLLRFMSIKLINS
jgi:chromosome segregation ATPase